MTPYLITIDGEPTGSWLSHDLEVLVLYVENRYPEAERIGVFEKEHGACLFAKWRVGAEIKTAWLADVNQHEWTNDRVPSCIWCGEWTVPLRVLGSVTDPRPPEHCCNSCFSDDQIGWDDLGPVVNEWALIYARGVDSADRTGYGDEETAKEEKMP